MFRNVGSQKVAVFAWANDAGSAKTGDAANISAQISIDGAATAATNDVNPTELDATDAPGIYIFDMTQAETNGDMIVIAPVSSTSDVVLRPVIIYTNPSGSTGTGLTAIPWNAAWDAEVQSEATDALNAYDPPTKAEMDTAHGLLATEAKQDIIDTNVDSILTDTADMQPRVVAIEVDTSTTLQAELDGIQADTEDLQSQIGASGAGLSAVPWNASWDAEVQSECADALIAYDPPTKAEMDTGHGLLATEAKQDIIDTNVDQIETAVITNAAGVDVAADIIALKAETALIVADTNELQTDDLPTLIAALPTAAENRTEMDSNSTQLAAIVADTNELQTDDYPTSIAALPTAAEIKTAIEAAGSHLALIKAVTDALTTAAATKIALSAGTIVVGTVSHDNTAATTTVFYCDDITEATADHYNGRIVIFTSGALQYQASDITDYELDTGEGKFTVTALTEAAPDDTTFIIV